MLLIIFILLTRECNQQGFSVAMVGAEAASLGSWIRSPAHTDMVMALASLESAAAVATAIVVLYYHLHSLQASAVASMYLSVSLLFDTAKARGYFAIDGITAFGRLPKYTAAIKLALVLLDEIPKRNLIMDERLRQTVDSDKLSGFWNRVLFVWFRKTALEGYYSIRSYEDLPELPLDFSSRQISEEFGARWSASRLQPNALRGAHHAHTELLQHTKGIGMH